jgi:hypothetical protein
LKKTNKEEEGRKKLTLDPLSTLKTTSRLSPSSIQARAGLAGKPSSLMMLPSMVDILPSG